MVKITRRAIEYASDTNPHERNSEGQTFVEYLSEAEAACKAAVGLSIFDLADQPWHDNWQDAVPVDEVMEEMLEEEGFLGAMYD